MPPDFFVVELFAGSKRLFTFGARTARQVTQEIKRVRPRVLTATRATIFTWRREEGEVDNVGRVAKYPVWKRAGRYSEELR